jgi:hypothetical protein
VGIGGRQPADHLLHNLITQTVKFSPIPAWQVGWAKKKKKKRNNDYTKKTQKKQDKKCSDGALDRDFIVAYM